jgi:predicted HicB family RNase H-like nuclease
MISTGSPKKRKNKTAMLTMRVDPQIKAAAQLAAERDHRSLTSFIEILVLKYCEEAGIDTEAQKRKEAQK